MQRMFSMFPAGFPGIGLISLRLVVSLQLLYFAYVDAADFEQWTIVISLLFALLLCIGVLTPVVAVLWALICIFRLLAATPTQWSSLIIAIGNAVTLALLGPGAYSLDARLFGRRLVRLTGLHKDQN